MNMAEALASFKENGFVVIPEALTPAEIRFLNAWVDRDLREHPDDWHAGQTSLRSHAHPLMENPQLDRFVQHPSTFPLLREILGEEIRFGQFDFREVEPDVLDIPGQHLHGDRAFRDPRHPAGDRPEVDPEHPYECGYLCAIHYLSDVEACCPCFGIVPGSWRYPTLEEAQAGLGAGSRAVPIRGPAGTALLYHIATYHGRMAGTCTHGRRTLHAYYSRASRPVLTNWCLIPERLAFHPDPVQRAFYSHWSPAMRHVARWFMGRG
jgi:Phytanoyl-CoA dioxygenase (PhyH)